MPDENLQSLYHGLTRITAILSGHYQSMVFDTKTDVYYVGNFIEKCRDLLKESSDEIEMREPKAAATFPNSSVKK